LLCTFCTLVRFGEELAITEAFVWGDYTDFSAFIRVALAGIQLPDFPFWLVVPVLLKLNLA